MRGCSRREEKGTACRKETWCGVAVMGLPMRRRTHRFSSVAAVVAQMKS